MIEKDLKKKLLDIIYDSCWHYDVGSYGEVLEAKFEEEDYVLEQIIKCVKQAKGVAE